MHLKEIIFLVVIYYSFIPNVQPLEVPEQMMKMAKKLSKVCLKQTDASEELLRNMIAKRKLTDEREVQCYLHCMLEKVGLMDTENIVHLEYLYDILPEEFHFIISDLIAECGTQDGADACEIAYRSMNCYVTLKPLIFGFSGFD